MAKKDYQRKTSLGKELQSSLFAIALLMVVFAFHIMRTPQSVGMTLLSFFTFAAAMTVYVLFARTALLKTVRAGITEKPVTVWYLPAALWLMFNIYALLSGQINLAVLVYSPVYIFLPVLIALLVKSTAQTLQLTDVVIILLLWLPLELGVLPNVSLPPGYGWSLFHISGILVLFYVYLLVRDLSDIGFVFKLKQKEWHTAIMVFLPLLVVLILLGMALHFLSLSARMPAISAMLSQLVIIYFLTALPEEMLFRGVFQNLLEKRLQGKNGQTMALIITSVIFGLAHGNNATGPVWQMGTLSISWAYVLMATLAGFAYGYTWIKTRKITASALVHLLVNWTWLVVFNG